MIMRFLKPLFCKQAQDTPIQSTQTEQTNTDTALSYMQDLEVDVLARTIFGEARNEGPVGMEAVACVVLNRVKTAQKMGGYWWGNSIIQVCQKPYQFSCWNKDDPNLKRMQEVTDKNIHFATCLRIARRAVIGSLRDITQGADHYHADYVAPYWAEGQKPLTTIGRHIFYRLIKV